MFIDSTRYFPVNAAYPSSTMSRYRFIHCSWYIQVATMKRLTLVISELNTKKYFCSSEKEFLLYQSLNETTGRVLQEVFQCQYVNPLPKVKAFYKPAKLFTLRFHSEYQWKDNITAIAFMSSKGVVWFSMSFAFVIIYNISIGQGRRSNFESARL